MELVYGMPDVDGGMCLLLPNDNFLIFPTLIEIPITFKVSNTF